MSAAANYSALEVLRDGRRVEIRALKPYDRDALLSAVNRVSPEGLFRRFFAVKRYFSEQEIAFFTNVDFVNHVALVAIVEEAGRSALVGGGRYVVTQPGEAELAFAVIDQYQGQGLGTLLLRHLVAIARAAGLQKLTAEVLANNTAMTKVFERSGLRLIKRRESDVMHVVLLMT
jgi:RimJ/RimL family protein N-acetyltransferase